MRLVPNAGRQRCAPGPATPSPSAEIPEDMKSYVICTTARSGSNLLCDVLGNTRLLGRPREAFNPDFMRNGGYQPHIFEGNKITTAHFIDWIENRHRTPNGVFGTKVLFEDFGAFRGFESFHYLLNKSSLVHLRRRGKVRQAISYFFAEETGQWIFSDIAKKNLADIVYSFYKIKGHLDRLIAQDSMWTSVLSTINPSYIEIYFEDFVSDMRKTVFDVARTVSVDVADSPIRVSLEEQKNSRTQEFYERFTEDFQNLQFRSVVQQSYKGLEFFP